MTARYHVALDGYTQSPVGAWCRWPDVEAAERTWAERERELLGQILNLQVLLQHEKAKYVAP